MFKKFGRLAIVLLIGACGKVAPDLPLPGSKPESSDAGAAVPLQGIAVDSGQSDPENSFADAPQPTGGGFFVEKMICRYTGVGLFRSFGCKVLDGKDVMPTLPKNLEAKLTILDVLRVEIGSTMERDPSGTWHWIGTIPNVSAVGAIVRASLRYEGKNFDMEAPILEMGVP